jgi:hypothetical protein
MLLANRLRYPINWVFSCFCAIAQENGRYTCQTDEDIENAGGDTAGGAKVQRLKRIEDAIACIWLHSILHLHRMMIH